LINPSAEESYNFSKGFNSPMPHQLEPCTPVLLSLALVLGFELSLRTHLKSVALKVESLGLALRVESLTLALRVKSLASKVESLALALNFES